MARPKGSKNAVRTKKANIDYREYPIFQVWNGIH